MTVNLLWITNTIFPDLSNVLGLPKSEIGGWMYALASKISSINEFNFAVATVYDGNDFKSFKINNTSYYLIPVQRKKEYSKKLEAFWTIIYKEFRPDLVHIHGTEFMHGLACMRACPSLNYVISVQGFSSAVSKYYYADISYWEIFRHITLRDVIRLDTIFHAKKEFEKRGNFEKEYLVRSKHVIGRTSWDFAHTKFINPRINYHFCNEILRESFYKARKWDINAKTNYSIFLSQAGYPIKGLHQVLKAISLLKKEFSTIKLRVAGLNIVNNQSLNERLRMGGYGSYILSLIKKFDLHDHIVFTGTLTEGEMIKEYREAHIFICPSSIENSPNSLGEAQILGVPCIGSFVGGIPDMIQHNESGLLYRFEETEMLAQSIRTIFSNNEIAKYLSANSIKVAELRHNPETILNKTLEIYQDLRLN